uniref:Uncharacterized protein n=1 Tax=viral metagenome TaxID=1070528 RepID=A0A6C0C1F6_9ZZZZ
MDKIIIPPPSHLGNVNEKILKNSFFNILQTTTTNYKSTRNFPLTF